jgi:integrase/recombinase XerD
MDTAERGKGRTVAAVQRYQSGLIIALLAARPLRIRNFQAITIGESLRWDGGRYWLVFTIDDTKMRTPIEEPLPDDLIPYLEAFLRTWRPVLLRQTRKFGGEPTHRRLWVDRSGQPMKEFTLRSLIKRYTQKEFGTAVWPHLFRDCLLTSVAVDQPDLMRIGATLLGHASSRTGEKQMLARRGCQRHPSTELRHRTARHAIQAPDLRLRAFPRMFRAALDKRYRRLSTSRANAGDVRHRLGW